jgi:hypothetical protein
MTPKEKEYVSSLEEEVRRIQEELDLANKRIDFLKDDKGKLLGLCTQAELLIKHIQDSGINLNLRVKDKNHNSRKIIKATIKRIQKRIAAIDANDEEYYELMKDY